MHDSDPTVRFRVSKLSLRNYDRDAFQESFIDSQHLVTLPLESLPCITNNSRLLPCTLVGDETIPARSAHGHEPIPRAHLLGFTSPFTP
jgi:hypothetical protein